MSGATITLERRMARSAAWMVGLRLADRSIGLVSVLFLARLLVPADFGLVAMGTVILGVLEAMTAFGFEMALIKRQAKDRERWDSAWTLNVIIGVANGPATITAKRRSPAWKRAYQFFETDFRTPSTVAARSSDSPAG